MKFYFYVFVSFVDYTCYTTLPQLRLVSESEPTDCVLVELVSDCAEWFDVIKAKNEGEAYCDLLLKHFYLEDKLKLSFNRKVVIVCRKLEKETGNKKFVKKIKKSLHLLSKQTGFGNDMKYKMTY